MNMNTNMETCIKRINELYHKSKTPEGLTADEKQEQKLLRQRYLENVRGNLRSQLNSITIQNPDGSRVNLGEKNEKK